MRKSESHIVRALGEGVRESVCHFVRGRERVKVYIVMGEGVREAQIHGVMESWSHGVMVSWCHGVMVSGFHEVTQVNVIEWSIGQVRD